MERESAIYFITKDKETGKLSLDIRSVDYGLKVSDSELHAYISYAQSLSGSYCNGYPDIPNQLKDCDSNDPFKNPHHYERVYAIKFNKSIKEIAANEDVVAVSHRYQGWKTQEWQFNDDISFEINTNFGYGSCSYFFLQVFYKGVQLTPYADLLKYRFVNVFSTSGYDYNYSIMRYTYRYKLEYQRWYNLMRDAIDFYNAVVEKKECEIFRWITGHLTRLADALESMIDSDRYYFVDCDRCYYADDLVIAKAEKFVQSTKFIDSIAALPCEIDPALWLRRLSGLYLKYIHYADNCTEKYKSELASLEAELRELASDWRIILAFRFLEKFECLKSCPHRLTLAKKKFLVGIRNRFFKSYSNEAAIADIKVVVSYWERSQAIRERRVKVEGILEELSKSRKAAKECRKTIKQRKEQAKAG